ncbi:DUF5955 family protein [Streptomyces oceani]|uniref:Uncharacterized protein n=1 Tax=Streptomyces oceani TaxID=1075402 RepID=A0A1E7KK68_9ACTN|nr:DUF5955 family protein [Streptomyces oceani]OEV04276.1 hypothetical protein AN216_08780 [Streptomyces oceani]
MRSETVGRRTVADQGVDARIVALRRSVDRVRRELAEHPAQLPDRQAAEEELAELDAMARAGSVLEPARLRESLLLVAAAVGSVSALHSALAELRGAIEVFGAS